MAGWQQKNRKLACIREGRVNRAYDFNKMKEKELWLSERI